MIDKEEYLREFLQRMRDIHRRGLRLTAGLAKFNTESILRSGNACAPLVVQLPEEAIEQVKDLIIGKDLVAGGSDDNSE